MSEKTTTTPTKDNTPARLKIEQEYNDKKTGSGWSRFYKVSSILLYIVHPKRGTATGKKQSMSTHTHTNTFIFIHASTTTHIRAHAYVCIYTSKHIQFLFLFDLISTKM